MANRGHCIGCAFAQVHSKSAQLQCRRYPPETYLWPTDNQHPVLYTPITDWPFVGPDQWCGEFKERGNG